MLGYDGDDGGGYSITSDGQDNSGWFDGPIVPGDDGDLDPLPENVEPWNVALGWDEGEDSPDGVVPVFPAYRTMTDPTNIAIAVGVLAAGYILAKRYA